MGPDSFTFLHAADLHIDSPLVGLVRYEGAPVEELRAATRRAFENLVEAALTREVAFVILAGDLFDGEWRDYGTGLWFSKQLRRFSEADIPVYLISGNHDAESRVQKKLTLPSGVHRFPSKAPKTIQLKKLGVALHGQSFGEAHVTENLSTGYPVPVAGMLNVGILHTGLEGYEGHGHYAPCTLEDLTSKGYDYWALGHIHKREVRHEDPWVVFPGNLQGRHAKETGPKGATLVHVEGGQIHSVEALELDVSRWAHVRVDANGAAGTDELFGRVENAVRGEVAKTGGRPLAVRVTLTGETPLDSALRLDLEHVRAEVRSRAMHVGGDVWIEKVRLETSGASEGGGSGAPADGAGLAGLAKTIQAAELSQEEAQSLARDLHRLERRLPDRIKASIRPTDPEFIQGAVPSARDYLAALLSEPADEEPRP